MSEQTREQIVKEARAACAALRDAARTGTVIDFRKRDPLIIAIHRAIDLAEAVQGGEAAATGFTVSPDVRGDYWCNECGAYLGSAPRCDQHPNAAFVVAASAPSAPTPAKEPR